MLSRNDVILAANQEKRKKTFIGKHVRLPELKKIKKL